MPVDWSNFTVEESPPPTDWSQFTVEDQPDTEMRQRSRKRAELLAEQGALTTAQEEAAAKAEDLASQERTISSFTPAGILNIPAKALAAFGNEPNMEMPFKAGEPIIKIPEPTGTGVLAGLGKLAAQTISGATTPETIVTAPALATPIGRLLLGTTMAKELPEQVQRGAEVLGDVSSTPAEKVVAAGTPAVTSALLAGVAAAGQVPRVVEEARGTMPEAAKAAEEVLSKSEPSLEVSEPPKAKLTAADITGKTEDAWKLGVENQTPEGIAQIGQVYAELRARRKAGEAIDRQVNAAREALQAATGEAEDNPLFQEWKSKQEVSNASSQQSTAAVNGDLRTPPGEGAGTVPVAEGGQGVRVNANQEPTGVRPPEGQETPPVHIEQFLSDVNSGKITSTQDAQAFGKTITTPEEIATLKKAYEEANAAGLKGLADLPKDATPEQSQAAINAAYRPQMINEAIEQATGAFEFKGKDAAKYRELMDAGQPVKPVTAGALGEVGMGGAKAGEVPEQSDLAQLTESLKGQKPSPNATVAGRVNAAKQIADAWAKGKDAITGGLGKIKAASSALYDSFANLPKWDNFQDALGKWSGADNASGVEVRNFLKAINKAIPSKLRQEAITNWIQANGDATVLRQRAAASKPALRPGYEEALTLTPDEQTIARNIQNYLESRLQQGIEAGILKSGVDNYVNQVWKKENPATTKLKSDLFGDGKLNPNFKYAKQRIFDSYFTGEQAGYTPRNKSIGALIASYDAAFNKAVASRGFIKSLHEGTTAAGEPIVEVSGKTIPVPKDATLAEAFLIKPRLTSAVTADGRPYRTIDHWALRDWKWATTGADGQPVLVQGDMVVHPDYYHHLKNVLGKSALRSTEGIAAYTTAPLLKGSAVLKQTKLSLSPFHLTQEGIHGLFHRVNPANLAELDMSNATQRALVDHGLQVADPHAAELFGEGLAGGGLTGKIPGLGKVQNVFNEWLFQDYIPRLKMTMAMDALERNRKVYAKDLSSGKITDDQLQALTARQANAAFGELNYRMLGRNPTVQDFMRLSFLAPDFLEARGRFVGQALKPFGHEQRAALGLMGATLYVTARILNQYLDNDPHWDKPFSVIHDGREYYLRTVLGDVQHLVTDPRRFIYNRLSPASRTTVEGVTSRDDRGMNRNFWEQAKDVASWLLPIPTQKRSDQTITESIIGATGVANKKYSARNQIYEKVADWKKNNPDPKIQEQYEQARAETRADSPYKPLRDYVEKGDAKAVREEYQKLLKTHTRDQIARSFVPKPFTGSAAGDAKFVRSLSPADQQLYNRAKSEQEKLRREFYRLK